jgi:lysophospholipase L1-like esterase
MGLLACELGLRVRGQILYGLHNPGGSSLFVRDARTGLRVPRAGYHLQGTRTDIRINAHGFRGEEIARVKPPACVRIACIGASATFCRESSTNAATWPARLEAALRAAYPARRIEVINAGVPGYVLATARKNLVQRVLPLDPDIVIVCESNNDMAEDTRRLAEERGLVPARGSKRSLWATITRSSMLADYCHKNTALAIRRRVGARLPHRAGRPPNYVRSWGR